MSNKYAIYSDSPDDNVVITMAYDFCKTRDPYCTFHIFSDNEQIFYTFNIATLSTYYLKFYDGNIIFCNLNDYIEYENSLLLNGYVVTSTQDLINAGLSKNTIKRASILGVNGGKLYEV